MSSYVDRLHDQLSGLELDATNMQRKIERLQAENKRLRGALQEIAYSKFCDYENTGSGQYGIGVTDGHRYCAKIAREALQDND